MRKVFSSSLRSEPMLQPPSRMANASAHGPRLECIAHRELKSFDIIAIVQLRPAAVPQRYRRTEPEKPQWGQPLHAHAHGTAKESEVEGVLDRKAAFVRELGVAHVSHLPEVIENRGASA